MAAESSAESSAVSIEVVSVVMMVSTQTMVSLRWRPWYAVASNVVSSKILPSMAVDIPS